MKAKIGAQTITWGENVKDNLDHIVGYLAEQGYRGVETGMRYFYPDRAVHYREPYADRGIHPLGIHCGGKFWDPAQAAEEMSRIGEAITFAALFSTLAAQKIPWLVVEQDYTSRTAEESLALNMEYLRKKGLVQG